MKEIKRKWLSGLPGMPQKNASEREKVVFLEKAGIAALLLLLLLFVLIRSLPADRGSLTGVTPEVESYRQMVEKACKKEHIPAFSNVVLAIIMQESAGVYEDVMQCSESGYNTEYAHDPNSITDPEYSIAIGVKTFAACLKLAKCKKPADLKRLKLALQGYNYGEGYITWALENYHGYSPENAQEFSWNMCAQLGWDSYGDPQYPEHVLQYFRI